MKLAPLLAALALAGCLQAAGGAPPSTPASVASVADVVAIPIEGTLTTAGLLFLDQTECSPTAEGTCELYGTETVLATGGINGSLIDRFHGHYFANGSWGAAGAQAFTGAIPGCGAGTMTFAYTAPGVLGVPDEKLRQPGYDDLTLIPGSTSTGLASVVGAHVFEYYNISQIDYSATGELRGTVWCKAADVPAPIARDAPGVRAVSLAGDLASPGTAKVESFHCSEEDPDHCGEFELTELVDVTGPWSGVLVDHARGRYLDDGSAVYTATRIFTGTIDGCGSGTLSLLATGTIDATPHLPPPGYQDVHDAMVLAPGSQSSGFANLVDVETRVEGEMNMQSFSGHGTYEATAWCRDAPASAAPTHTVAIDQAFTSPGMHLFPDQVFCDPSSEDVCEFDNTQMIDLPGPAMTGTILDVNRIRANPDGTYRERAERIFIGAIAGCGSGIATFEMRGTAPPVAPTLAKPGTLHIRETPMVLAPGATSTGFAGLLAGQLQDEADVHGDIAVSPGDGRITGSLTCA